MTKDQAIYILRNAAWLGSNEDRERTEEAVNMAIEALSSEKTGEWERHPAYREWDVCSSCGIGCKRREYGIQDGHEWVTEEGYDYCPHCGARMVGESDG